MKRSGTDSEAINYLIKQLGSNDGKTREKARLKLVDIGKEATQPLIKALSDKRNQVRWEAAKALGGIPDPGAIPPLVKALEDEVFDVRWLAAEALIANGLESVGSLLEALVTGAGSLFLRESAHHVITAIMRANERDPDITALLKPVVLALDSTAPRTLVPTTAQNTLISWIDSLKINKP